LVQRADVSRSEVYDAREIARAAGRTLAEVTALIDSGLVATVDGRYVSHTEAVRVLRALRSGAALDVGICPPALFSRPLDGARDAGVSVAASTAVHGVLLGAVLLVAVFGRTEITEALAVRPASPVRLVFLAAPGPGGGGGGGGTRQPLPPAAARREGQRALTSPVPPREPLPAPVREPQPAAVEPAPAAPVASVAADRETRTGVIDDSKQPPSTGPGAGGGAGTGAGGGLGQGQGDGIGEGAGGGAGGGPWRPGSGIEPPSLLREVRPDYPEDARRRSIEGDVVLEIVVRHDGSVGDVRVLHGLGDSLDQRAVQAVRQWRFAPARRRGEPVDVLVEVSVEFKLR
jgi:periplasmic protein TonB